MGSLSLREVAKVDVKMAVSVEVGGNGEYVCGVIWR